MTAPAATTSKPARKGLMAGVLGRMAATETLISDRHSEAMLVALLNEAEQVSDPQEASDVATRDLAASWGMDESELGNSKPFLYRDGTAIIPVHGILINRFSYCWGFVTGYDYIRKMMNAAEADADVQLIVFDHDSPGGEAAGCDELAREIAALETPTMAMVNTLSASGAFWLACPCDRFVCAPSGTVGSIGVYILHMSMQKLLEEWGFDMTYIQKGEFKTSGSPYKELSDKDRAYLQGMVDERYDEFVAAVAEFRGIEEGVARDTEARVMRPAEAISLGLIDAAAAPAQAVADYLAELGGGDPEPEQEDEQVMADKNTQEMSSEQKAAERKAERERISAIVNSDEAEGREDLAKHFAYNTEMSPDDAVAALKAAPKAAAQEAEEGEGAESEAEGDEADGHEDEDNSEGDDADEEESKAAAKGGNNFENAMNSGDNPNVGANGGGGNDGEGVSDVDKILGAQALATGRKLPANA